MGSAPDAGHTLAELRVGALVALRGTASACPALVVALDEDTISLHVAGRPRVRHGERVTVGWSSAGRLREVDTRVARVRAGSQEVAVLLPPGRVRTVERRGVERFPLAAEALLLADGREHAGRVADLSVLGVGLTLRVPGPPEGRAGELLLHDAGARLLSGAGVTVAGLAPGGTGWVRVGVEFSDPAGVADATERLLTAVEAAAEA